MIYQLEHWISSWLLEKTNNTRNRSGPEGALTVVVQVLSLLTHPLHVNSLCQFKFCLPSTERFLKGIVGDFDNSGGSVMEQHLSFVGEVQRK